VNLGVNSILVSVVDHKEEKRKYIYIVMEGVKFLIS